MRLPDDDGGEKPESGVCEMKLNKILAERTGQSLETIIKDTDRDNFLSAQEACEYGLIDKVIEHR